MINKRIRVIPPKAAVSMVFKVPDIPAAAPPIINHRSKATSDPAKRISSQMAVACLKFWIKERKKDFIVESSSSRTSFKVT